MSKDWSYKNIVSNPPWKRTWHWKVPTFNTKYIDSFNGGCSSNRHVSFRGVIHIQNSLQVTIVQQQSWKLKWQLMMFHRLYPPNPYNWGVFGGWKPRADLMSVLLQFNIDTQNSYISKEFQRDPKSTLLKPSICPFYGGRVIPKNLTFLTDFGGIKFCKLQTGLLRFTCPPITKTGSENRSS